MSNTITLKLKTLKLFFISLAAMNFISAAPWLIIILITLLSPGLTSVTADSQTNFLNRGCSTYNATDTKVFVDNLNGTFSDLRAKLSNSSSRFATAQRTRRPDPIHAMVQCRDYLSSSECLGCFTAAVSLIRNCSLANGARVILDGCLLRYESNAFFDQTTLQGNIGICGNKKAANERAFSTAVTSLLAELVTATPKIKVFFAAAKREVSSGSGTFVYAVAQCAQTVTSSGCNDCLVVAQTNIARCPPDTDGRAVDAGCFVRYSSTPFFRDNQTTDLAVYLKNGSSSKKGAIIGGVVGGFVLLSLAVLLFLYQRYKRKPKKAPRGNILGATELRGPANFGYRDLKAATKGFSEQNKLGEGGFGDVYKGDLKNGKIVAVKRLAMVQSARTKVDFESEVKLISNVHHRNLLRLLGCCSKREELLLVYEYMANSSLDKYLFGEKRGSLSWKQRFDIIIGIARGLAYLHDEFHVRIIHRDIKSSNILLDEEFQPKIADFGLARLLPEDQSHLSTKVAGTMGYTAPEYAIHGQLSEKVDTYSYGVVVLEIVCGRKSNDIKLEPTTQYLLEMAWRLYEEDMSMELVDKSLELDEYDIVEVKKVIEIALSCTQSSVSLRPTMSEVVVMLLNKGNFQEKKPTRPTFIDAMKRVPGDTSSTSTGTGASSISNATISFTEISSR